MKAERRGRFLRGVPLLVVRGEMTSTRGTVEESGYGYEN